MYQETNLPEKLPFEPVPVIIIDEFLEPPKGTVAARDSHQCIEWAYCRKHLPYRIRTGVVALHVAACCPDSDHLMTVGDGPIYLATNLP
jgi:hypothetical protein